LLSSPRRCSREPWSLSQSRSVPWMLSIWHRWSFSESKGRAFLSRSTMAGFLMLPVPFAFLSTSSSEFRLSEPTIRRSPPGSLSTCFSLQSKIQNKLKLLDQSIRLRAPRLVLSDQTCFAASRLITNTNLVACSTDRSGRFRSLEDLVRSVSSADCFYCNCSAHCLRSSNHLIRPRQHIGRNRLPFWISDFGF
jgi:hypothetical protein